MKFSISLVYNFPCIQASTGSYLTLLLLLLDFTHKIKFFTLISILMIFYRLGSGGRKISNGPYVKFITYLILHCEASRHQSDLITNPTRSCNIYLKTLLCGKNENKTFIRSTARREVGVTNYMAERDEGTWQSWPDNYNFSLGEISWKRNVDIREEYDVVNIDTPSQQWAVLLWRLSQEYQHIPTNSYPSLLLRCHTY